MPFMEKDLKPDPFDQFTVWFSDAKKKMGQEGATAMCLSTLDAQGYPEGRMVLLKDFDPRGFVFYTNLNSTKGRAIVAHPRAGLTFYWQPLERQVRILGNAELVSDEEADRYFHSRPRLSQLGAWASLQSQPLKSRFKFMRQVVGVALQYPTGTIPRPPHWHGFRIKPIKIEFWKAAPNRLHDRFLYEKQSDGLWTITRLYP